jgi:hypothetical protein
VATDNIGLAKVRDGTTLVRIGEPLRPEFAAWRYGDQFGRRRRRQFLIAGGGLAALGAVVSAGAVAGVGLGAFSWMFINSGRALIRGDPEAVVAKVRTDAGNVVHVRRRHLGETWIGRGEGGSLAINLRYKHGQATFVGREAERIASIVIPKVNRFGGSKQVVANAVGQIESAGGAEGFLERLALVAPAYSRHAVAAAPSRWGRRRWNSDVMSAGLFGLPPEQRIALEMALHEEVERRAIQGELAELERAWREAEEIAGIADSLLLPEDVSSRFERMRRDGDGGGTAGG